MDQSVMIMLFVTTLMEVLCAHVTQVTVVMDLLAQVDFYGF